MQRRGREDYKSSVSHPQITCLPFTRFTLISITIAINASPNILLLLVMMKIANLLLLLHYRCCCCCRRRRRPLAVMKTAGQTKMCHRSGGLTCRRVCDSLLTQFAVFVAANVVRFWCRAVGAGGTFRVLACCIHFICTCTRQTKNQPRPPDTRTLLREEHNTQKNSCWHKFGDDGRNVCLIAGHVVVELRIKTRMHCVLN